MHIGSQSLPPVAGLIHWVTLCHVEGTIVAESLGVADRRHRDFNHSAAAVATELNEIRSRSQLF